MLNRLDAILVWSIAAALAVYLLRILPEPMGFRLDEAFRALAILAAGGLDVCLWVLGAHLWQRGDK